MGTDIEVEIDGNTFTQQDFSIIQQLSEIIKDSGQVGKFKLGKSRNLNTRDDRIPK